MSGAVIVGAPVPDDLAETIDSRSHAVRSAVKRAEVLHLAFLVEERVRVAERISRSSNDLPAYVDGHSIAGIAT